MYQLAVATKRLCNEAPRTQSRIIISINCHMMDRYIHCLSTVIGEAQLHLLQAAASAGLVSHQWVGLRSAPHGFV